MSPVKPKGAYPLNWRDIATRVKDDARWTCVRCEHPHDPAAGRTLTVHHFDGDKANCERHNLMALCQACHLSVQGRVDPANPLMFSPNAWAIPYILTGTVAGDWLCERYFGVNIPAQIWHAKHDGVFPVVIARDHVLVQVIDQYHRETKREWPTWATAPVHLEPPTLAASIKERYDHDRHYEEARRRHERDTAGEEAAPSGD